MNIFMARQFLKEGFINLFRHPLVTLASITTIALMLMLMGGFHIFSQNANQVARSASQQPPILIWVEYGADITTVEGIEQLLREDNGIKEYSKQTPEENFEKFKEDLGEDSDVLDGFDPKLLPYTFTVQLYESAESESFKIYMEGIYGVRKVEYSQPVTEFLNAARNIVNIVTFIAFIILGAITLFIISNMVRIAVYSRSQEIGIMKYVGATNRYIRIPFIIEGSITGFMGAMLANLTVLFAYSMILDKVGQTYGFTAFFRMVPLQEIFWSTVLINVVLGIIIGGMGSAISVKRHVKV